MDTRLVSVVLMRVDADPPTQHVATLAGGQRELVVLSIDGSVPWTCGENIIIVAGEPGQRRFVQGVYVAPNGRFHLVRKTSSWRRFDARQDERYDVRIEARLRSEGGWRAAGTIHDISTGGLAVEVPAVPPTTHLRIEFSTAGFGMELPISLVSMSDAGTGTLLHCRFEELSAAQSGFVQAVLSTLADEPRRYAA